MLCIVGVTENMYESNDYAMIPLKMDSKHVHKLQKKPRHHQSEFPGDFRGQGGRVV